MGGGVMVNRWVAEVASTSAPFRAVTLQVCTSGSSATVAGSLVSVAVIGSLSQTTRLPVTATIRIT